MTDYGILACPSCFTEFTTKQKSALFKWRNSHCKSCGVTSDLYGVDVPMDPDCHRRYLLPRKFNWYHLSTVPPSQFRYTNEECADREGLHTHIGTPRTVARYLEVKTRSEKAKGLYLYTFTITKALDMSEAEIDEDNWSESIESLESGEYDVIRYVNRFECSGQLSLIVLPETLNYVDCFEVNESIDLLRELS